MIKRITTKRKTNKIIELFTSPVLNLFIILIPFLLVTAAFVQTSVIDLTLPAAHSKSQSPKSEAKQKASKEKLLILAIAPQGFYLILGTKLIKSIPREKDYDFDTLQQILQKFTQKFPDQKSIIIESDDTIMYDHIIHTMDRCRACGLINISLSASKS